MPITTLQTILPTDKLQSGFRAKFNANVALLITDIIDNGDGTATVELQGGTNFVVDFSISFYTKAQVQALITAVQAAVWGAITGDVTQQTDVIGNLGVITPIDDLLFSVNFAVDAADNDNPFFGTAASGYASFSIPGTSGTGWQLLVKEGADSEVKFRVYFGGVWFPWVNILSKTTEFAVLGQSGITIDWQNDFIYGSTTFASALGNNIPKPTVYESIGNNYIDGNVKPSRITRISGLITEVVYDWGFVTNMLIVF